MAWKKLIEAADVALHHSRQLVVATVPGEKALNLAKSVSTITAGAGKQSMRRKLRKSVPFLLAIFIGTMAGALVAAAALFVAHS